MKKLITLLLAVAGMVSTVSADVTIRVKKGNTAPNLWAWNPDSSSDNYTGGAWPGRPFTESDEITIHGETFYSWTKTGVSKVKFLLNIEGDAHKTGDISLDGDGIYYFDYDLNTTATEILYISVAGDNQALFGENNWTPDQDCNMMTKTGTNTYSITYENVSLSGDVQYKANKNGSKWYPSGGNQTLSISKPSIYNVTFTFNASGTWSVTASATEQLTNMYLVGKNGNWGEWNAGKGKSLIADDDVLEMDKVGSVYSKTISKSTWGSSTFAMIDNRGLDVDNYLDWTKCFRPVTDGNSDWLVTFTDWTNQDGYRGTGDKKWAIADNNNADITISYNAETEKWSITQQYVRDVTSASEGYATFGFPWAVDVTKPEGAAVKYASAIAAGKITWEDITDGIPANQGVLLEGAGTYTFTPAASTPTSFTSKLVAIPAKTQLAQVIDSKTNYILAKVNNKVGFYKVNENGSWVGANTAYLAVASGEASARGFFPIWEDEATSIEAIENAQTEGQAYNLAGQRIANPVKGLYIVNGKKVIIK